MNKWKSLYLSTALASSLVLASCTAEGDSDGTKSDDQSEEPAKEEMTITEKIIESAITFAVEGFISTYSPSSTTENVETVKKFASELLNNSPQIKDMIDPFLSSIQPLVTEADTEYYNVTFSHLPDGDTYNLVVQSAYSIKQSDGGDIEFVELSNGDSELSIGEEITVRNLLIDSPEVAKNGEEAEPYADEAKKFAEKELKNATSIVVAFDKGERYDHYSRNLMYVWTNGDLLSKKLLERGLAKLAYINEPNTTYLTELQVAENRAISENRGIWSIN